MAGYIGNTPVPQATQTRDEFVATEGQTTFGTSGYSPGYLDVYLNGIHLDPSDYTATNGTDVVLTEAASASDVIHVIAWTLFEATNVDFDNLTNKPTTLAGYGITDGELNTLQILGGSGDEGTLSWNSDDQTLNLNLGTASLQLGQEQYFFAKATEAISNGELVMFAGAQGDHLLIAKADHGSVGFDPSYVVGVATQDFANNDFGYVTVFGKVRNLDTSAYSEGTILYFDPDTAGGLTSTKPTPPDHIIQCAAVVRSHANQGTLLVRLTHTPDTDETPEGSTNLYYTDARVQSVIDTNSAGFATTSYVDTAESDAVSTANAYTDTRETAITSAYQAYADTAESDAVTTANAYTDTEIANIDALPSQSGNSGKYLTTDGTNASWAEIVVDDEVAIGANEPSSPFEGQVWYDTNLDLLKAYDGTNWNKVSPVIPTISSISGTVYETVGGDITITGTGFLSDSCNVEFSGSFTTTSVNVTASSNTSIVVAVPAVAYASDGTVTVKVTNSDNGQSPSSNFSVVGLPTGGSVTTSGGYRIHTFTSSGTFTVSSGFSSSVDYLLVAGGGAGAISGGGGGGGGGGAGGMLTGSVAVTAQSYTVIVGGGGTGVPASEPTAHTVGTSGSNSSFASLTALGGGRGGGKQEAPYLAASGGSGGGAGATSSNPGTTGGSGTSGQGNSGGSSVGASGGGGGGKSGSGANGVSGNAGNGGAGASSSISGSTVFYAGGGAGSNPSLSNVRSGGSGGGGNTFQAGGANRGGGGGAGWQGNASSGNGGSGIVIIRYAI